MKKNVLAQTKSLFISAGHSDTDPGAAGETGWLCG
jgi:N-acetylmuramoyl-L-alanine amidase